MLAAERGHLAAVQRLVQKKAEINHVAKDGWTAFRLAVRYGHIDVAQYLAQNGALTGGCRLETDIPTIMDNIKGLPTGKLLPVENSKYDLRKPKTLAQALDLDNVYFKAAPRNNVSLHYDNIGLSLKHEATEDFTRFVIWTPEGRDYFALENQTCANDAHNFYDKGFKDEAHLIIIRPGETKSGTVEYIFINQ